MTDVEYVRAVSPEFKARYGDWKSLAEAAAMAERVKDWLSADNLDWAKGKTRDEILARFGNQAEPVGYVPNQYLRYFENSGDLGDNRVYSGRGYFIDHAVNHHPEIAPDEYRNLQDILNHPDEVIIDRRPNPATGRDRNNLMFVKQLTKKYITVVALEENDGGKIVFHKSLHTSKKTNPHPGLPRMRASLSVDGKPYGNPTIDTAAEATPGGHLSARDNANTIGDFVHDVNPADIKISLDENGEPRMSELPADGDASPNFSRPNEGARLNAGARFADGQRGLDLGGYRNPGKLNLFEFVTPGQQRQISQRDTDLFGTEAGGLKIWPSTAC